MVGRSGSACGTFQKCISYLTNKMGGPFLPAQPKDRFKRFAQRGRRMLLRPILALKRVSNLGLRRFNRCLIGRFFNIGSGGSRLSLLTQIELELPAMVGLLRVAPYF